MADTTTLNETTRTIDGTEYVRLATAGANWKALLSSIFSSLGREKLTAARTYYVRTDGSDSNTGLLNTAGGALLTIQKAVNVVSVLDVSGYAVTIQVAAGTYAGRVDLKDYVGTCGADPYGQFTAYIVGDATTPTNVVISNTGTADTFKAYGQTKPWTIDGFKITSVAGGSTICHVGSYYGGNIFVGNNQYGTADNGHLQAGQGGKISLTEIGGYSVSGDAAAGLSPHFVAFVGGQLIYRTPAYATFLVTITNTPNMTHWASADSNGSVEASGVTFTGAVNAAVKNWNASLNGAIQTYGGVSATYFPGNGTNTQVTGGQYA